MIKNVLKRTLPGTVKNWLSVKFFYYQLKRVQHNHKKALKRVRKKETIKVVFFLMHEPAWKCESIYRLLSNDERFETVLVVNPFMAIGEENMLNEMNICYETFKTKGYKIVKTFNENTGKWLDVKRELKPDIVFFTNPYQLTRPEYYIHNFPDTLTCYIPYSFMLANLQQSQFNLQFHNFVWRCFYGTPVHKMMAEKYARNKGVNVYASGFPMCDIFFDKNYLPKDVWTNKDKQIKRIIWAPHHTIENNAKKLGYSNFLKYHQDIPNLVEFFEGRIQIAFKPHPLLKFNLYKHPDWGKERTDAYYQEWQLMNNGQLEEGGYEDLFLTSDALILDSISFISEYTFLNKPSLFLIRDESIFKKFNEFGEMAFNLLYKAFKKEDIYDFMYKIVLNGEDSLLNRRLLFKEEYLVPPDNQTAGFNIYQYLLKETTI
jgi:hypothetical protein